MAQYDGSIRINTGIDVKGFEKGKKELESNTKSAAKSIGASIKGMEKEFEKLDKSIWKTAPKITSLTLKANDMRNLQIPTKEYADAQKEVDKYTESLQKAKEKIDKLLETGVSKESSRFVSAQYDVAKLENKLLDAEEVVKRLEQEGKAFTLGSDTNEFANISNQIEDLTQKMQSEQQRQSQLQSDIEARKLEKIKAESTEEERLAKIRENAVVGSQQILKIAERRKQLLQEIADMEAAGIGAGYRQYDSAKQEIDEIEQKIKDYSNGIKEAKENYKKLGDIAKKSFSAIGNVLKSANSTIDSFVRKIKLIAQNHLPHFRKETDKTGSSFTKFNTRLKSLLSAIFIFNVISSGFRKMFSGIGEGFKNFYSQSSAFSSSIDNMRQSLSYLQNSFAAAFSPIIEVAIPYIQKLIDYMSKAVNAIAQFVAALFANSLTEVAGNQTKPFGKVEQS